MANYVQMSKFGRMGRWGNQVFQYAFLKTYALEHNLEVRIPAWVGEELYGFSDKLPLGGGAPRFIEKGEHGVDDTMLAKLSPGALRNHEVEGWFQYHTSYYRKWKRELMQMFAEPNPTIAWQLKPAVDKLKQADFVIGLHFRRGDYGRSMFYITPMDWYFKQLDELLAKLVVKPTFFVATEDDSLLAELQARYPTHTFETTATLGIDLGNEPLKNYNYLPLDRRTKDPKALNFFGDWYLLQQGCDIILMPNSTFSFAAAMLSPKLNELYRSNPAIVGFEKIDPWDSMPSQFVKQADYEHLEGLYLKSNPYWHD